VRDLNKTPGSVPYFTRHSPLYRPAITRRHFAPWNINRASDAHCPPSCIFLSPFSLSLSLSLSRSLSLSLALSRFLSAACRFFHEN
jgi:hypothetical protein